MHIADRKAAFWVVVTVIACLFALFLFLAAIIKPTVDVTGLTSSEATLVKNMTQMMWWMTVALVMLPIMLLLITVAVWLFVTDKQEQTHDQVVINAANGTKTVIPAEHQSAAEVLDVRYARGEITRDQYTQMKKDVRTIKV